MSFLDMPMSGKIAWAVEKLESHHAWCCRDLLALPDCPCPDPESLHAVMCAVKADFLRRGDRMPYRTVYWVADDWQPPQPQPPADAPVEHPDAPAELWTDMHNLKNIRDGRRGVVLADKDDAREWWRDAPVCIKAPCPAPPADGPTAAPEPEWVRAVCQVQAHGGIAYIVTYSAEVWEFRHVYPDGLLGSASPMARRDIIVGLANSL